MSDAWEQKQRDAFLLIFFFLETNFYSKKDPIHSQPNMNLWPSPNNARNVYVS